MSENDVYILVGFRASGTVDEIVGVFSNAAQAMRWMDLRDGKSYKWTQLSQDKARWKARRMSGKTWKVWPMPFMSDEPQDEKDTS